MLTPTVIILTKKQSDSVLSGLYHILGIVKPSLNKTILTL